MGIAVRHEPCPECRKKNRDKSGDNLAVYTDGSKHCFSCGYTIPSEDYLQSLDPKRKSRKTQEQIDAEQEAILNEPVEYITEEQHQVLKARTGFKGYRGIRADTCKKFGVRFECDEETGEIVKMYYPATIKGAICGYKVRRHPKDFVPPIGYVGKQADMGGQFAFKTSSRNCVIVGGEIDQLSAFQMLRDYQVRSGKEDFEPTAVVTSLVGETATASQAKGQYEFFSKFQKIILCLDNDEAGQEAQEKLIKVLPKGRVYLMQMKLKDPNEHLTQGEEASFIDSFFRAKQYVPAGIITSAGLYEKVLESVAIPKVPLPPFMRKVQEMFAGGIPLGYLINMGAQSGIGKTSMVNEMLYYWIFNSPHRLGVVSMELDAGQYGQTLLSRHLQQKIALIEDPDEAVRFLELEDVRKAADVLFKDEDGAPRFHVVDDRDGSMEALQETIEQLIISCGCRVIICDPLSDMLDGLSNDEQSMVMKWMKGMIKSHKVSFINICHVRKGATGQDSSPEKSRFITEEDFSGSSTIFKSAGANILLQRNKYADDPVERNTTQVYISKNRWAGKIGPAGEFYYDNATHTLYDKQEYFGTKAGDSL